jgi:excisionase family DNA binding protein
MDEAAEYLSISKSSLYKLCSKNELLYRKIGRKNRFTAEDLDQFVQRQVVKKTESDDFTIPRKIRIKL